ncbi:hypothetical protein PRZ48_012229 [Zasmidium cellare]|uniref:Major facilitator superfamily (MFS) profile domain-containing protein n=1 Tax=Zasmidium cellare TaxID=395010 RepID=A0ABR0E4B3_ZASCE|nr:hypothetical protein PRZ48_012229 [Zasmidium cellare]
MAQFEDKHSLDDKPVTEFHESPVAEDARSQLGFDGLSYDETRKVEKRLLRKIDLHLIVPLFFLFCMNILDRSNVSNAKLGGLKEDLGLTETQYQTAVAVMFAGYLGGQIPSNIALTRLRPSYYLPAVIFIWGGISLCFASLKNYSGILAARIFLGIAESPFFPGALLMISSWYKPSEIAPRVAFMYCGNTVANAFGGLLAAGVLDGMDSAGGLEGWRWLYIIEGAATMVAGVLAFWLLPDFPSSGQKSWLTAKEHSLAKWRMSLAANDETDENGGVREGLKAALSDPKVWMLVLVQNMNLTAQTWTYFFPSIVKTLGFDTTVTLLITAPVYFFGFFTAVGNSLIAAKTNKRAVLIMWPLLVDIAGNVMVISSHSTAVRYTGMFLMCAGSYSAFNVVQAWVASTIPRTRTKRGIAYAMVNMFGNLSNVYGSYFFPDSDAPQYWSGGVTLSSFAAGGIVCSAVLGTYLCFQNKKAAKAEEETGRPQYRYMI